MVGRRSGHWWRLVFVAFALAGCSDGRQDIPASDADRSFYPPGPYGLAVGDTIADYGFDEAHGVVRLQDLRGDPRDRLLVLFGVQTWPNACAAEAEYLADAYDDYQRRGVEVLGVLVEDFETEPTPDGAHAYFGVLHDAPYRYAADSPTDDASLGADLARRGLDASPVNLVVDLDTMAVTAVLVGWSQEALEGHLYYAF